jgi:hypothetical protein
MATGLANLHRIIQALLFYFVFKTGGDLAATGGMARRSGTETNAGLLRVSFRDDLLPEFFQFSR